MEPLNQNAAGSVENDKVYSGLAPKTPTISTDRQGHLPHAISRIDVDESKNTAKNRPVKTTDPGKTERVERVIVGIVLFVITVVPLLTFLFSFGNVGDLGTSLGIDERIAYLTGPAVDLTATGMIVAATWLSYKGHTEKELWRVHTLSIICALIMFALNCGPAIYQRRFELAGFSAVGPFLLMAMGFVGPWLLRQITDTQNSAPARTGARHVPPRPPSPPERSEPAPARPAGTAPAPVPPSVPPVPAPAGSDAGATTAAGAGTRTPFDIWVKRAVPLWNAYIKKHQAEPIAAVLGNQVRLAHPEPNPPTSDRWDRKLSAAVREAAPASTGQAAEADDESEAVAP